MIKTAIEQKFSGKKIFQNDSKYCIEFLHKNNYYKVKTDGNDWGQKIFDRFIFSNVFIVLFQIARSKRLLSKLFHFLASNINLSFPFCIFHINRSFMNWNLLNYERHIYFHFKLLAIARKCIIKLEKLHLLFHNVQRKI